MAVIVMGHIRFEGGKGNAARTTLADHMATVATEDGCEAYSFAYDAADPDLVRVAERWASPEALAAHGQADHQKAFGRAMRDLSVADIRIDAWTGEHWRNLIGG